MSPPGARGTANARADIVLWYTVADRKNGDNPLIVVECKADNVTIDHGTYTQGGIEGSVELFYSEYTLLLIKGDCIVRTI